MGSMTTDKQEQSIGIFDSGVGGLTVLRELYRQLPNESIIYFGDTARLPYGIRSSKEIIQFVREIITWFLEQNVKMILMACNTSSALALDAIRSEFDIPILGLILPGARAAVQQGKRIGVIATPATVASNAYRQAILEVNAQDKGTYQDCQVWQIGCPAFVPLIESNRIYDIQTYQTAREYLTPLIQQQIDTLIFGCTHYPLLEPVLRSILPNSVKFIDPAIYLVNATAQEIELLGLTHNGSPKPTRFCVSGSPEHFAEISKQWLGYTPLVEQVTLPNLGTTPVTLEVEN